MTTATDATDLWPALRRLDLRLRASVDAFREELSERARDPYRGLYLSDADVDALLAGGPLDEAAAGLLSAPLATSLPRLGDLARRFGLDAVDLEALLICLAPEVDPRYERLYGYLHDDVTRRRPTVDLIARLLAPSLEQRLALRARFGPDAPLLRDRLLTFAAEQAPSPLLSRPLRLDERIVDYLLGSDAPDPRLAGCVAVESPASEGDLLTTAPEIVARLAALLAAREAGPPGPLLYLRGAPGSAKRATARAAAGRAGWPLVTVDLPQLLAADDASELLALATREARLRDAALCLDGIDHLLGAGATIAAQRAALRRLHAAWDRPVLFLGEARWEPAAWWPGVPALRVDLPPVDPARRAALWQRHLNGHRPDAIPSDAVAEIAARFHLDERGVQAATAAALGRARWRGDEPTVDDLREAARVVAAPPLADLARHIEPRYGWDDIVLTRDARAQMAELCTRARYQQQVLREWGFGRKHARRAGLTALFAGPPGTGKSMAAEIVAGALGLDLYRIDLSAVVSKYIGETEKNLERIFRAADQGDAVLLFDEADALFGKRSETRDAHDRYANVEIAYLLQRLEIYEGVAVLTTNLRGNVDEAFTRRLDFVVDFPLPEEPERLAIWRQSLPPEAPRADDLDLEFLARRFKLSGGHIRNIALAAAFLAAAEDEPIAMPHLVRATRREHQKLGKMVAAGDFERYSGLIRDSEPIPTRHDAAGREGANHG